MQDQKMKDQFARAENTGPEMRDQMTGVEKAGPENVGPILQGWKMQDWKMQDLAESGK